MRAQCLLQKFTSCCIARDLRMLHIKMFVSNVVLKSYANKQNAEFPGHVQIKQTTNSLNSVQHFKSARSTSSPASLLSTCRYPRESWASPSDSLSRPSLLRSEFRIFNPWLSHFVDWRRLWSLGQMISPGINGIRLKNFLTLKCAIWPLFTLATIVTGHWLRATDSILKPWINVETWHFYAFLLL